MGCGIKAWHEDLESQEWDTRLETLKNCSCSELLKTFDEINRLYKLIYSHVTSADRFTYELIDSLGKQIKTLP